MINPILFVRRLKNWIRYRELRKDFKTYELGLTYARDIIRSNSLVEAVVILQENLEDARLSHDFNAFDEGVDFVLNELMETSIEEYNARHKR